MRLCIEIGGALRLSPALRRVALRRAGLNGLLWGAVFKVREAS